MFTSKKAQVLSKKLDKISPITNIDTLYYEQATFDGTDFTIKRRSVAKTMPVNVSFLDSSDIYSISNEPTPAEIYFSDEPTIINGGFKKIKAHTKFNYCELYKYQSDYTINLSNILAYYEFVNDFNSSSDVINSSILDISSKVIDISNNYHTIVDISNIISSEQATESRTNFINTNLLDINQTFDNTNTTINNLEESIYNYYINNVNINVIGHTYNDLSVNANTLQSGYYYLIYNPSDTDPEHFLNVASFLIELYHIKTISENFYISTGRAYNYDENSIFDANECYVEYDFKNNKITYLRDKFNNDGDFDFINIKTNSIVLYNNVLIDTSVFRNYNRCTNNHLFNVIDVSTNKCNVVFSSTSQKYDNNDIQNIDHGKCELSNGAGNNVIKNIYNNEKNCKKLLIIGNNNTIINFTYNNFYFQENENPPISLGLIRIYGNNIIINNNYQTDTSLFSIKLYNSIALNTSIYAKNDNSDTARDAETRHRYLQLDNCEILNSINNLNIAGYHNTTGTYSCRSTEYQKSTFLLNENIRLCDSTSSTDQQVLKQVYRQIYIGSKQRTYYYDRYITPNRVNVYCNSYSTTSA